MSIARRRIARPEQVLQKQVAAFLDAALVPPAFWFHCPNGGARSKVEGAIFKAMGVKPGIPDCIVVWNADGKDIFLGPVPQILAIELKAKNGRETPDQRRKLAQFKAVGASVAVCKSLDEVIAALTQAGVHMRGRIAA